MSCTISGTAALESTLSWIPALTFGNPWFKSAPEMFDYSEEVKYDTFTNNVMKSSWDTLTVSYRLFSIASNNSLFLTINPSNENYFSNFYQTPGIKQAELKDLQKAFSSMITLKPSENF